MSEHENGSFFMHVDEEPVLEQDKHGDGNHQNDEPANQVKDEKKPDATKKPINKIVKIVSVTVLGLLAAGGYVAWDMSRQQAATPETPVSADGFAEAQPQTSPASSVAAPVAAIETTSGVPDVIVASSVAATQTAVAAPSAQPAQVAVQQPQPGNEAKFAEIDGRLTRIEGFLSQQASQAANSQPKVKRQKQSVATGVKTDDVTKPAKRTFVKKQGAAEKAEPVCATKEDKQSVSRDKTEDGVVLAPAKPVVKRVACEYRGGINNRAWVVCDDELRSVKAGDSLPQPYGEVTAVNDQAGTVSTTGGLIQ